MKSISIEKLREGGSTEEDICNMVEGQMVKWAIARLETYEIFLERQSISTTTGKPEIESGDLASDDIIMGITRCGGLNAYWRSGIKANVLIYLVAKIGVSPKLVISTALDCIDRFVPQAMVAKQEAFGASFASDIVINDLILKTIKAVGNWCGGVVSTKEEIEQILYIINKNETLAKAGNSTEQSSLYAAKYMCEAVLNSDDLASNLDDAILSAAEAGARLGPETEAGNGNGLNDKEMCLKDMSCIIRRHIDYSLIEQAINKNV